MKANRKFLREGDEAVSPVIAVILMVAITVVLAATVYVWVSGFGSQSSSPAKSVALTSASAIVDNSTPTIDTKTYTVASATPGLKWSDLTLSLAGTTLAYSDSTPATDEYCVISSGTVCAATLPTSVSAGQQLRLYKDGLGGTELRILDSQANSVILTLTIG